MKTLTLLLALALVGCGASSEEPGSRGAAGAAGAESQTDNESGDDETASGAGGTSAESPSDALGGMGGDYWGPWLCKDIPGGRQCARYPADSSAYDD